MIHARDLTRSFTTKAGVVEAVAGIDLDVEEGELVAFLGPNGAGKTTTLRMLTTLLPPTSGTATVAGHDVVREPAAVRRRIGYIGQGNGAGHYHHVRDELVLQARAYGFGWREARRRADELLAALQLETLAKRTTGTLSGGQRRRLDIAMGLVHAPPLLFLDEPSTGLDPQNRANLWEHVLGVRQRFGTTLFLTTHYLDEADTMAERVMIIDHGRVIADDTPAALKADLAGDRVVLTLATAEDAGVTREVAERLAPLHAYEIEAIGASTPDGAATSAEVGTTTGPTARADAGPASAAAAGAPHEAGTGSRTGAGGEGPGAAGVPGVPGSGAATSADGVDAAGVTGSRTPVAGGGAGTGAGAGPRTGAGGEGPGAAGVRVRLRLAGGAEVLPPLLRELDHRGVRVRSAEVARPTLDDVFLSLTGRSLREEDAGAEGTEAAEGDTGGGSQDRADGATGADGAAGAAKDQEVAA